MEFKERVELHRPKLEQNVEAEKLYPLLQQYKALTLEDITLIQALPTKQSRVGKLLDILLAKDSAALQSFYLTLQKMYQHILIEMFIEPQFTARDHVQESCSTSITSDSEDDGSRSQISTEPGRLDFLNRPKTTKIIPSHHYDPNSTMSSSFPTFSEHFSLVSSPGGGGGHHSPIPTSPPDLSKNIPPDKAYGWFFKQFESAFNELKVLKQQNAEMMDTRDRYDQVSKEADHLRAMCKSKAQAFQQVSGDLQSLKTQQADLLSEKTQLLDEISGLQKLRNEDKLELSELRHQQRKAFSEENTSSGMSEMYAAALDKYDNMHKDFDVLREQYAELAASRSTALSRLDTLSEENSSLLSQLDEMKDKNEALSLEWNGLKHQCTNAIREWNQALIKHSQAKEKLNMVIKQRDDFCKDFNQTFAKYTELKKNYEALRAEKDAAVKEYALVMSERDTVHKEIEQLQDKLTSVSKHADVLAKEKKDKDQELETLRQDMSTVLSERDKYRRERNDISGINQGLKNEQMEFRMRMELQRDNARKERNDAYDQMEQIIKEKQQEKADEIDNAVKETDGLKKQIEKLKLDLENMEQEAENANKNRDKAYSERDKIVQERESIRTLCDNLRRDRDRAVSDLAQALRDSDDFKRQKNEALKELKEIKSRYEAMVEKDSRRNQLHYVGHNNSRDSAIDADLQDIGAEAVEIPVELDVAESGTIGFEVLGGKDEPQFPNDPSIIVSTISKAGPADGKLKVNDTILRINGVDTFNMEKRMAVQVLHNTSGLLSLFIRRRKSTSTRIWQPVQIVLSCQKDPGILLDQGLFIGRINPGGIVAKYGLMPCVGDRIININNIPVDSLSPSDAMKVLETATDCLVLDVWRQSSPFSSAGSSPTPTSTGINSPLPEGMTVSSSMSKSDSLAIRSCSWDMPSSVGSSKNLRNSGSQTDSLDSPGPSPGKALRHPDHDKVRHSLPMLDKAKEKVERIFRSRNKSQEREKEAAAEEKRDKELECVLRSKESSTSVLKGSQPPKVVEDCGTQVDIFHPDNASSNLFNSSTGSNNNVGNSHDKLVSANANVVERSSKQYRKREFELDSNCGTWPKTRGQQQQHQQQQQQQNHHNPPCPSTVISTTGHKSSKERPSVKDLFFTNHDARGGGGSGGGDGDRTVMSPSSQAAGATTATHHDSQNSDMSMMKYSDALGYPSSNSHSQQSASSAFTPTSITAMNNNNNNNQQQLMPSSLSPPLPPPSTTTNATSSSPAPLSIPISSASSSKSQSHFSVGILHGPSMSSSSSVNPHIMPSRAPPVYVKPSPGQQLYGTMPSHKHAASSRGSWVSQHQSHGHLGSATLPSELRREHGHRGPPKVAQMKGRRPPSSTTTHRSSDKHWQAPPPVNWPANHRLSCESPISGYTPVQSSVGTPVTTAIHPYHHRSNGGASPSLGPSPISVSGGGTVSPTLPVGVASQHVNGVGGVMSQFHPWGTTRPSSLEVPPSMKASSEFVMDLPDRHRISSPTVTQSWISPGIIHSRTPPHLNPNPYHHSAASMTSPSSPPGTFPVIRTVDLELDRPLSFHGPPTDRYSSPSLISQKSCSTIERFTPTIGDEAQHFHYPRTSPHSRTFLDDDNARQTAFTNKRERDKMFEMYSSGNPLAAGGGVINPAKSGSVEIVSDRSSSGSPMFHIDSRSSLKYKMSPSSDEYIYRRNAPSHHETRDLNFDKTSKPFGFKIQRGPSGGIFVSSVSEHSPAAKAGLVIGDQLLEVCGINMRNAVYDVAMTVLRQCDNLSMKVQYNPEKYTDQHDASSTISIASSSLALSPTSPSEKSTPKHLTSPNRAMSGSSSSESGLTGRRFITLKKSNPNMLGAGFSFVGGNAIGIFIHEIYHECFVEGGHFLQRGDHILEFNSVDFRCLTAEKAMMELNRPCATIALCVVYNFAKYNKAQTMACDSFYIRANFDRVSESAHELTFSKEAVLYVENSLYKNQLGMWLAWLVDEQGTKIKAGVIPSRIRLEDELVLRRTHSESWSIHESEDLKGSRRGSASARRSFFRRKRHHRNNSKDSHEFGSSFSDASLNSDSVPILDDSIHGYTQVEKIEIKSIRPVLVLAPLAEALINKLVSESPDKYAYCEPVLMRASAATMDQSLLEGVLVDYWKQGDAYHCMRASAIKQCCHNKLHCLLNVTPAAIERMHQAKLYPIIIFVKHKKPKEIRDVRDPQFLKDRASHKSAKEQFEHFQTIEQQYHHLFSAVVQGGNLAEMSMQIKACIAAEQVKAIWMTTNSE